MLFLRLREDKNVINEDNNKLVQIFHEDLIHEIHEVSWGIGQSKGHDRALIQAISGYKCRLQNILGSDSALWGPRLISRDHRMHMYSDPRDQCSLNTQKLNNKSLTSIHTVLHKL